jgi:hypothetical protein
VLAAATGLHVVEEHASGWHGVGRGDARCGGMESVSVRSRAPSLATHQRHRLSGAAIADGTAPEGFFAAVLLNAPIGIWVYLAANSDGVASPWTLILSVAIGAVMMASAIGFLAMSPDSLIQTSLRRPKRHADRNGRRAESPRRRSSPRQIAVRRSTRPLHVVGPGLRSGAGAFAVDEDAYRRSVPAVGDVVVFYPPWTRRRLSSATQRSGQRAPNPQPGPGSERYIKRIAAGERDVISISRGFIIRNGVKERSTQTKAGDERLDLDFPTSIVAACGRLPLLPRR